MWWCTIYMVYLDPIKVYFVTLIPTLLARQVSKSCLLRSCKCVLCMERWFWALRNFTMHKNTAKISSACVLNQARETLNPAKRSSLHRTTPIEKVATTKAAIYLFEPRKLWPEDGLRPVQVDSQFIIPAGMCF